MSATSTVLSEHLAYRRYGFDPRPVLRCGECRLQQYLTTSGTCRRCKEAFFVSPTDALALPKGRVA